MSGILVMMGNLQLPSGLVFANRFQIERTAGRGGMGTVYRAIDLHSGNVIALKLLNEGVGRSNESERLLRESQILSELHHPGIVAHVAHGQTPEGQRFLAMEWLDGHDLGTHLQQGPLLVRDCIRLLVQICDALLVAHQRGIIHRDLKPTNLFLINGDVDQVKILDFGIARRIVASQAMTRTGMIVGTPEYMAPEQALGGRDLTTATDLFSIGCIFYECLTGQPPFVADHIAAVLVRILFEDPIPVEVRRPGIPAAVAEILRHLLIKEPTQRLADAESLRTALMQLGELPEPALAVTQALSQPANESFAEHEQNLFSIVLAAPEEEDLAFGATQVGSDVQLAKTDRRALLQMLSILGGGPSFLANGTLVVTVPPLASAQDQVMVAARAALLIKEHWPEARVAMATGRGRVQAGTAVGEVVDVAARSLARKRESTSRKPSSGVLVDPLSAKLLEGRFAQEQQPDGTVLLHEQRDPDASRPLLGKPTPCVGREAELATLESQLAACIDDSEPRVVLITAPAGAGKSRLRHEFLRCVARRSEPITMLLARGDMMTAGAPYGMLRAAIHRLCGISGSEPIEVQRERLRSRVGKHLSVADVERVVAFVGELCNVPFPDDGYPLLQAARQDLKIMQDWLAPALLDFLAAECAAAPVLLVLDDLQWGDELTILAIDTALARHANTPLFVLAFARPEVHETFPRLWTSHKVQEIPLRSLSKKACERLIAQVLGASVAPDVVSRAIEQSAGNALYLEELIRSLAEGKSDLQSETVLAMLQARLGRLSHTVRRTALAASVFGRTFWRGGVAALLGTPESSPELAQDLAALVDAEFIQRHSQSRLANEQQYEYRHDLVRKAAYDLLAANDLVTGHRRAGAFLEQAESTDPVTIAEHFERGEDKKRAAEYYLRAGFDSMLCSDLINAQRALERGMACAPEGELRGQFHGGLCLNALLTNHFENIPEHADNALKLLRPGTSGWCYAAWTALYWAMSQNAAARIFELLFLLLGTEPEAGAETMYVEALMGVASPLTWAVPASLLETLHQRLTVYVGRAELRNPAIRRHLHFFRASLYINRQPKPWSLLFESEQVVALSATIGDRIMGGVAPVALSAWGWIELGDQAGVHQRLMALKEPLFQRNDAMLIPWWQLGVAATLIESPGDAGHSEAAQLLELLTQQTAINPVFPNLSQGLLTRLAVLRGDLEGAVARGSQAMATFDALPVLHMSSAASLMDALTGLGRTTEAVSIAEKILATLTVLGGAGVHEIAVRLAATEAFHAAGHVERAHVELGATLQQIRLRADDITDAVWKNSFLTRNRYCVRAQRLANEWGVPATAISGPDQGFAKN